jgi:hypothetical protein
MGSIALAASFQVSPTRFEFTLDKRFTNFFTVTNTSLEPLRLRVYARFIHVTDDDRMVEVESDPRDLADWVVLNPHRMLLPPSQRRVVRFSVRPPEGRSADLPAGEYRTVIFFEELLGAPESGSRAVETADAPTLRLSLLTRLGVTLYGMVGPKTIAVSAEPGRVEQSATQIIVHVMLINEGNAHTPLAVHGVLSNPDGTEIQRREMATVVQPGQRRRLDLAFDRPQEGSYQIRLTGRHEDREMFQQVLPLNVTPPASQTSR